MTVESTRMVVVFPLHLPVVLPVIYAEYNTFTHANADKKQYTFDERWL